MNWRFEARAVAPQTRGDRGAFEESRFGEHDRLAWPSGACEPATAHRGFGEDLAVIADDDALFVIDAKREGMLRIAVDGLGLSPIKVGARKREVCIGVHDGAIAIPFADLRNLPDTGSAQITLDTIYRERESEKRVPARVVWVMSSEALVNVQQDPVWQMRIPNTVMTLSRQQDLELVDELWPKHFAYVEAEGQRVMLNRPRDTMHATISWRRVPAKDPAAGATDNITGIGSAEQLIAQIGERPDDLDAREILIDLLAEAGEACAETFALLGAGKSVSAPRRREALGPLGHFLRQLEFRAGLPWAAVLAKETPTVPDVIAAAIADVRFGMFETLRVAGGPHDVFEQLITTRRLPGLRRVDVVSIAMLRKLKKLRYTRLVQLWGVPITGSATFDLLADPTFAQVTELELQLERKQLHKRLDAIVAAKSVLAGRHVAIAIPDYRGGEIAARLFGADLPCASLTIGRVTVANGVVTTHERYAREIERIARELRDRRADQRSNA